MNDLQIRPGNVPANIDDLAKFALIGREKLVAVRAEIRAIEKVGLAQEVREQKLREAQEISEAVLDAEVRIGELMAKVPKATKGTGSNQYAKKAENDTDVDFSKAKADVIRDAGFKPWQVQRFQTLAANPELVAEAKAEARENDDIVSRSLVLSKVKAKKQEEKRQALAEEAELLAAGKRSTQAYIDTLHRQQGDATDGNMVGLEQYRQAKEDIAYYQSEEDYRLTNVLMDALKAVDKIPTGTDNYESMWRGCYDPEFEMGRIRDSIDRLTDVLRTFTRKGGRNIENFDEGD